MLRCTPDGAVKVLDFGLAKCGRSDLWILARPHLSCRLRSPPHGDDAGVGVLLGTAAYMSPEQTRGTDRRQAHRHLGFRCVFYEVLTGLGACSQATTVRRTRWRGVLEREPDWQRVAAASHLLHCDAVASTAVCRKMPLSTNYDDVADARLDFTASPTYVSNETGRDEVYVRAFPSATDKRQISTAGGFNPAWSRNGRKLVFLAPIEPPRPGFAMQLMEAEVTLGTSFTATSPRRLFEAPFLADVARTYDLTPDAGRFVFTRETYPPSTSEPREMQVIENWFGELRRRVPAN